MKTSKKNDRQKRKVLIVDDHPIIRYGVARILSNEPDLDVCGDADSAHIAMECIEKLRPDIVVMDISLKGMDGLHLTKKIRSLYRNLPIVILSMHDERYYANRALRAGANGYVMKEESFHKLVAAIRTILNGDIFVSETVQKSVLHAYAGKEGTSELDVINKLSDREREIFLLIGVGHTSRTIADKLILSVKTIETHRSRIKQKLGLDSPAQMTMASMEWARRENLAPILT